MAIQTSFKQKCPSCENLVPIKDPKLVGKKIDCPFCKDRFVVEKPGKRFREDDVEDEDDDLDEVDEVEEEDEEEAPKKKPAKPAAKGKAAPPDKNGKKKPAEDEKPAKKGKKAAAEEEDEDEEDDDESPKKKKGKSNKKMMVGLALGLVGVVLIGAASYLILGGGGGGGGKGKQVANNNNPPVVMPPIDEKKDDNNPPKVTPPAPKEEKKNDGPLTPPGAELTNLLPNDSEHVFHVFAKDLFEPTSPLFDAVFGSDDGATEKTLKAKLGFAPSAVDDLIRAERYGTSGWSYAVVHLSQAIDEAAVKKAMNLKAAAPIKNQTYYQTDSQLLDRIGRFALGVSNDVRTLSRPLDRPTFVYLHNAQTMIVGDQAPIKALLEAEGQFKLLTPITSAPVTPPTTNPNPGTNPMPLPGMPPMPLPGMPPTTGTPTTPLPGMPPTTGTPTTPLPGMPPTTGTPTTPLPGMPPTTGTPTTPLPGMPPTTGMPTTTPPGTTITPPGMPPMGSNPFDQSVFQGTEQRPPTGGPLKIEFKGNSASVQTSKGQLNVPYTPMGNQINIELGGGNVIQAMLEGSTLKGTVREGMNMWNFEAKAVSGPLAKSGPGGTTTPGTKGPSGPTPTETYLTVRPALKAILDQLELKGHESKEKVLFSSVTDLDKARLTQVKEKALYPSRTLWDFASSIDENKLKLRTIGVSLVSRDTREFRYRTNLETATEIDARDTLKSLENHIGPNVIRWIERILTPHKVELAKHSSGFITPGTGNPGMGIPGMGTPGTIPGMPPMGSPGTGFPMEGQPGVPKKDESKPESSRLAFNKKGTTIEITLDLILDQPAMGRVHAFGVIAGAAFRAETGIADNDLRFQLAKAVVLLGEKGASEAKVGPGQYPPAALVRPGTVGRAATDPASRISWMATLLPYMGHDSVYAGIKFDESWRSPANWIPGRVRIAQFQDPTYPEKAMAVTPGAIGTEFGSTHYVGVAGVGLDAADYKRGDPATQTKRGVFSYDGAASMEEIHKGRGASNTMMMLQVPHDTVAGVTPWIAGGGATVRGVPEKNSVAPFVLGNDRNGKPIENKGKTGTYAVMADGSVRFIAKDVSDDVFKAMATVNGPAPADLEKAPGVAIIANPNTPAPAPKTPTPIVKTKEAPKTETKKEEAPKVEPKTETPKVEAPKPDIVKD